MCQQWVRSLHPNALLVTETVNDASGPFSASRVARVFDYNTTFFTSNDICCSMSAQLASSCDASCEAAGPDGIAEGNEWRATKGFRFGFPQMRMRVPEPGAAVFSQPLDRQHMLVIERFFFLRTFFIVIGMEGERRHIRPSSHETWVQKLREHGFVLSPAVPAMTKHLCHVGKGYQQHIRVTPTVGGVALDICGRDVMCSSLWTTK